MNVRKTVKKILALGAGVTMVGATVMGAMAYDLANYPAPFINNGVFDGSIVVGEHAAAQDIMGAIDIAASLQAMAVSKEAVTIPGQTGKVSLEGDTFKVETGSDKLELREPLGAVVDTVTSNELSGLKSGHITTSQGDTDYDQYLYLRDASNLQDYAVNYVENDDNEIADFLVIDTSKPFMEWEIQFPEGFESERDSSATWNLDDLEDKTFNIMGTDYTVVKAKVDADGSDFKMTLMAGSVADTLKEGETKTYTIDGVEYEVTLVFVSDPQSGGNVEAKFSVNGEVTQSMQEGDTDVVSGNIQIGVRDILANARDGVASFFLGADKVEFSDSDTSDSDFATSGEVKINNDNINDGEVEVQGQFTDNTNETFEITSIKYRLTMDAIGGSTEYLPAGHGIREFMDEPEALISDSLDIRYEGLEDVETKDFQLDARGDDKYKMTFTNIRGQTYDDVPYLSYDNGLWKFGDDDDELIFVEPATTPSNAPTAFSGGGFIGHNDYFIVSDARAAGDKDKSVTNVLRYTDYDSSSKQVEFEDLATSGSVYVTVDSSGEGDLHIGGNTYTVKINQTDIKQPLVAVDLDGSGDWNDTVTVTTWGGAYINLASNVEVNSTANITDVTGLQSIDGHDLSIEDATGWVEAAGRKVYSTLTVDDSRFDTTGTDETMQWYVDIASPLSDQQVDAKFSKNSVTGPHMGSDEWDKFDFTDSADNSDHNVGMTDYGIYIDEYDPSGSNNPNELTLSIPEEQRLAQVFITLGSVTATQGGAGVSTEVVNPISVGLAVLDKDAPAVGTANMIVVGGPCVNTVAAELMGNPADCAAGFTAGKAMIKSFESNGKVAILVAGMNAEDTVGASYVLANYKDYAAFQGDEVEVVVPDLSNIVVQAVTAAPAETPAEDNSTTE